MTKVVTSHLNERRFTISQISRLQRLTKFACSSFSNPELASFDCQINGPQSPRSNGPDLLFTYRDFTFHEVGRLITSLLRSPISQNSCAPDQRLTTPRDLTAQINSSRIGTSRFTKLEDRSPPFSRYPNPISPISLDNQRSRFLLRSTTVIKS
jgi:hypothetical protein